MSSNKKNKDGDISLSSKQVFDESGDDYSSLPFKHQNIYEESNKVKKYRQSNNIKKEPEYTNSQRLEIQNKISSGPEFGIKDGNVFEEVKEANIKATRKEPLNNKLVKAVQSSVFEQSGQADDARAIRNTTSDKSWLDTAEIMGKALRKFSLMGGASFLPNPFGDPKPSENPKGYLAEKELDAYPEETLKTVLGISETALTLGAKVADWIKIDGLSPEAETETEIPNAYVETKDGKKRVVVKTKSDRGFYSQKIKETFDKLREGTDEVLDSLGYDEVEPLRGESALNTPMAKGIIKEAPEGMKEDVKEDIEKGRFDRALSSLDKQTAMETYLKYSVDPSDDRNIEEIDEEINEDWIEYKASRLEERLKENEYNVMAEEGGDVYYDRDVKAVEKEEYWREFRAKKAIDILLMSMALRAAPQMIDDIIGGATLSAWKNAKGISSISISDDVAASIEAQGIGPVEAISTEFPKLATGVRGLQAGTKLGAAGAITSMIERPKSAEEAVLKMADGAFTGFMFGNAMVWGGYGAKKLLGKLTQGLKNSGVGAKKVKALNSSIDDFKDSLARYERVAGKTEKASVLSKARSNLKSTAKDIQSILKEIPISSAGGEKRSRLILGGLIDEFSKGIDDLGLNIDNPQEKAEILAEEFVRSNTGKKMEELEHLDEYVNIDIQRQVMAESPEKRKEWTKKVIQKIESEYTGNPFDPNYEIQKEFRNLSTVPKKAPGGNWQEHPARGKTELVSTDFLDKYKEYDRREVPKVKGGEDKVDELKENIEENGLNEPLILQVGKKDGKVILGEGNTRLAALKEMGYDKVPVKVTVQQNLNRGVDHDLPNVPADEYFPSQAKPSKVFDEVKSDEEVHIFNEDLPEISDELKEQAEEDLGFNIFELDTVTKDEATEFFDYITGFQGSKLLGEYASQHMGNTSGLADSLASFGHLFGETRSILRRNTTNYGINFLDTYYNTFDAKSQVHEIMQNGLGEGGELKGVGKKHIVSMFKGKDSNKIMEALLEHQKYIQEGGSPISKIAENQEISETKVLQKKYGLEESEAQTAKSYMDVYKVWNDLYRDSERVLQDYVPLMRETSSGEIEFIDTMDMAKAEPDIPFENIRTDVVDSSELIKDPIRLASMYKSPYLRKKYLAPRLKDFDEKINILSHQIHDKPSSAVPYEEKNSFEKYLQSVREELSGTPTSVNQADRYMVHKTGEWIKENIDEQVGNAVIRYSDSRGLGDIARNSIMLQFMPLRADHAIRNMLQSTLTVGRVGEVNFAKNAGISNPEEYNFILADGNLKPTPETHMDVGEGGISFKDSIKGLKQDVVEGMENTEGIISKLKLGGENIAGSLLDGHAKQVAFHPLLASDTFNRVNTVKVGSGTIEDNIDKLPDDLSKATIEDVSKIPGFDTATRTIQGAGLQAVHHGEIKAFTNKEGETKTLNQAVKDGENLQEGEINWNSLEGILIKDMVYDTQYLYDSSNLGYLFRKNSGPLHRPPLNTLGYMAKLAYAPLQSWGVFFGNYLSNLGSMENAYNRIATMFGALRIGTGLLDQVTSANTKRWYDPARMFNRLGGWSPVGKLAWELTVDIAPSLLFMSQSRWDKKKQQESIRQVEQLIYGDHTTVGRISNVAEEMYNIVSREPRRHSALISMLENSIKFEFKEKHKRHFIREISKELRTIKNYREKAEDMLDDTTNKKIERMIREKNKNNAF